jgi:hypothetical protein
MRTHTRVRAGQVIGFPHPSKISELFSDQFSAKPARIIRAAAE